MFSCDACGDVFSNAIHARSHDLRRCTATCSDVLPVTAPSSPGVGHSQTADDDIDFGNPQVDNFTADSADAPSRKHTLLVK